MFMLVASDHCTYLGQRCPAYNDNVRIWLLPCCCSSKCITCGAASEFFYVEGWNFIGKSFCLFEFCVSLCFVFDVDHFLDLAAEQEQDLIFKQLLNLFQQSSQEKITTICATQLILMFSSTRSKLLHQLLVFSSFHISIEMLDI